MFKVAPDGLDNLMEIKVESVTLQSARALPYTLCHHQAT